ncbi:C-C chemokine receptor type 4-like [Pseudophryne corroboree]|uniref:C-C chemokine receptor type 4-like n=1 Tax=Pseudophryne corroboree TaxID=495146 RepID=UPI0030813413
MEEDIGRLSAVTDYNDYSDIPPWTMSPVGICEKEDIKTFVTSYMSTIFYILFCISVLGNSVILVILFRKEKLQSVTNIYILNLVVSDSLFSITLPFTAADHSYTWIFGRSLCKLNIAAFYIGFQSFVIFITLTTIDQYFTIVHSWSTSSRLRVRYAVCISCMAWVISIILSIPDVISYTVIITDFGVAVCEFSSFFGDQTHLWLSIGHYKHFIVFYLGPLSIIIFCYSRIVVKLAKSNLRKKSRALKVIFLIASLFFLCWTPYNILMFLMFKKHIELYAECNNVLQYIFHISQTTVYVHCCLNPFLYAFLGTKFRRHLKCSFKRRTSKYIAQQQEISLKTTLPNGI